MKNIKIDFNSWFYKNCKRQRKAKAKAKICQVCPFRSYIEKQEIERIGEELPMTTEQAEKWIGEELPMTTEQAEKWIEENLKEEYEQAEKWIEENLG